MGIAASNVRQSIREVVDGSKTKKRNFIETIELQIGLKNYDVGDGQLFNAGTGSDAIMPAAPA